MKNAWLIILCLSTGCLYAQNGSNDNYDNGSVERLGQMGKAYLSEIKKIANISYSDINLNVNIRKERSLENNTVARDVYFNGTNADGPCEGFIEESEAGDAISALQYINDSLLPQPFENEIHFAKRFTNSYFVIYASYIPGTGKFFAKGEWDINLQLNEHENSNNQGAIHIKRNDVFTLIQILETCKEKLKTF